MRVSVDQARHDDTVVSLKQFVRLIGSEYFTGGANRDDETFIYRHGCVSLNGSIRVHSDDMVTLDDQVDLMVASLLR